jgi:hypothetical protein
MIDFTNGTFFKMKAVPNENYAQLLRPIFVEGENIVASYQAIRDGVVFTTERIIAINVQGITGKKKDISSLPYTKIQAFSVETAGVFDLDSELELWFSGLGKVKFEFTGSTDISTICRLISFQLFKK